MFSPWKLPREPVNKGPSRLKLIISASQNCVRFITVVFMSVVYIWEFILFCISLRLCVCVCVCVCLRLQSGESSWLQAHFLGSKNNQLHEQPVFTPPPSLWLKIGPPPSYRSSSQTPTMKPLTVPHAIKCYQSVILTVFPCLHWI